MVDRTQFKSNQAALVARRLDDNTQRQNKAGTGTTWDHPSPLKSIETVCPAHFPATRILHQHQQHQNQKLSTPTLNSDDLLANIQSQKASRFDAIKTRLRDWTIGKNQSDRAQKDATQRAIADLVSQRVNASHDKTLNSKAIRGAVISDLFYREKDEIQQYTLNNYTKVEQYVDRALNKAETVRAKDAAKSIIIQFQHRAFLNGKQWSSVKDDVAAHLRDQFSTGVDLELNVRHFLDANPEEINTIVDQAIQETPAQYSLHDGGGRFKSNKGTESAYLPATQVRTASGKIYELINTPTKEQAAEIEKQHGIKIDVDQGDKGVLGEGGSGKVRYAREITEDGKGEIVAVKKLSAHANAKQEVKEFNTVSRNGKSDRFVELRDIAHVLVKNKNTGRLDEKSYLFIPLANRGDGIQASDRIAALRRTNPQKAEAKLLFTASEYAGAVTELHAKGIYHHDIKPENFLHAEKTETHNGVEHTREVIKVSDYGSASDRRDAYRERPSGKSVAILTRTPGFVAPEMHKSDIWDNYRGDSHDAYALGKTLLLLKHNRMAYEVNGNHLVTSDGARLKLKFIDNGEDSGGFSGVENYPLNTYDNIIARLLHHDPAKRLSAADAHTALYTLALNHPESLIKDT